MKLNFKKKGIAFNMVTMIILSIVIILTIVMFVKMYNVLKNEGNREFCNLEGVKGQVSGPSHASFWKTYELNCKTEKNYLKFSDVDSTLMTQTLQDASKRTFGDKLTTSQITQFKLQNYFANKLKSCWKITGDNNIIQWDAIKIDLDRKLPENIQREAFLRSHKLLDISGQNTIVSAGTGKAVAVGNTVHNVACVVCSTTYMDNDLAAIKDTQDLVPLLKNLNFNDQKNLWDVLSESKKDGPLQTFTSQVPQSVVYYQIKDVDSTDVRTLKDTGVIVIPTNDIATMCSYVVNQQ